MGVEHGQWYRTKENIQQYHNATLQDASVKYCDFVLKNKRILNLKIINFIYGCLRCRYPNDYQMAVNITNLFLVSNFLKVIMAKNLFVILVSKQYRINNAMLAKALTEEKNKNKTLTQKILSLNRDLDAKDFQLRQSEDERSELLQVCTDSVISS